MPCSHAVIGMSAAGLGEDLLLANEVIDPERLRAMAELDEPFRPTLSIVATVIVDRWPVDRRGW